jgi:hypothetical protein
MLSISASRPATLNVFPALRRASVAPLANAKKPLRVAGG